MNDMSTDDYVENPQQLNQSAAKQLTQNKLTKIMLGNGSASAR